MSVLELEVSLIDPSCRRYLCQTSATICNVSALLLRLCFYTLCRDLRITSDTDSKEANEHRRRLVIGPHPLFFVFEMSQAQFR